MNFSESAPFSTQYSVLSTYIYLDHTVVRHFATFVIFTNSLISASAPKLLKFSSYGSYTIMHRSQVNGAHEFYHRDEDPGADKVNKIWHSPTGRNGDQLHFWARWRESIPTPRVLRSKCVCDICSSSLDSPAVTRAHTTPCRYGSARDTLRVLRLRIAKPSNRDQVKLARTDRRLNLSLHLPIVVIIANPLKLSKLFFRVMFFRILINTHWQHVLCVWPQRGCRRCIMWPMAYRIPGFCAAFYQQMHDIALLVEFSSSALSRPRLRSMALKRRKVHRSNNYVIARSNSLTVLTTHR